MSEMWRKTLVYLGLVEEPEDAELDAAGEDARPRPVPVGDETHRQGRGAEGVRVARPVRPVRESPAEPLAAVGGADDDDAGNVRRLRAQREREGHVRDLGADVRVGVIRPTSFEDAQTVGERYRSGRPVLLDLADVDGTLARRLLDFVSGTIFALRGRIQPAGRRAFLLVPEGMELPETERRRLGELGYAVELAGAAAE